MVRPGAVEGIYLWLTTATPAIYKYHRDYVPIKPSDALGSTPLTIRNIAMGNLLSMAKTVSRRIRRGGRGVSSPPPNEWTVRPSAARYEWLLFITYMTILCPSPSSLPLLISRPETRERRRRRWAIAAIFIIDRRRSDTVFATCYVLFFYDEKSIEKDIEGEQ